MKPKANPYRITVLAGIGLLIFLLGVMAFNLLSQLRDLSRAADDNMQWSISQIDTEFANLDATLTQQQATGQYPNDEVQLRVDIALSRLNIINSGRAAAIFVDSPEAAAAIAPINAFAEAAIAISDAPGPLTGAALTQMRRLVQEVRPHVRDIALLGVSLSAERSEARRAEFARQLSLTGGIAMSLLILMAILMLFLDRLLQRAARRDAALLASSKQLSATVAASLDAIVTADDAGRIIDFNAAAEDVFGWARDEIVGLTMEDTFIPHRMRDAHHNGMKRYLSTGKPRVVDAGRVELAALRKSGEEFPVELNITTMQEGDATTFIAYIRDISARKINEQKLIEARDRAERTDKAKSQFLTVMSHEMRTPLNGILGVLDMLKTTKLSPKQERYAKIATSSSEILLEQVNEALDITRIETGELQLTQQGFALTDFMQGLVDVFEPLAQEKGLALTLEIEPAMRGPYHGDAGRIRQILTNLIGNAIKFTEKGHIALHVSGIHGQDATSLRFAVSDTGIGIPADQQEQVFEDFFAFATSEGRQARGDGLGLSISRRIARAMEGDVSVQSTVGQGATFVLTLPVQRTAPAPDPAPVQDAPPPAQSCTILIVEDNAVNRSVLGDMLQAMGHSVHEAINGAEALDVARTTAFDLIFMDISMPVMDGIEATQRLRAGGGPNAATHIVGLTAHGREEYRESAVAAGMDRFHTKPIRLDALHSVIAEVTAGQFSRLDAKHFPQALTEMIGLLGGGRIRKVADTFLIELSDLIVQMRQVGPDTDMQALADAVHKAKGAAALLGQTGLEQELAKLENQARAGAVDDMASWVATLETGAAQARSVLDAAIDQGSDVPL
ncbi:ATP-binding protein [Tateyamaria sp.]|uniref:hybrid sensor histidine kinase/response regulator n=1 Tax=Tateyamaria sp. TaxID=1929288 RepID=UPI003B2143F0